MVDGKRSIVGTFPKEFADFPHSALDDFLVQIPKTKLHPSLELSQIFSFPAFCIDEQCAEKIFNGTSLRKIGGIILFLTNVMFSSWRKSITVLA
jgi:hypothetical protein